MLKPKNKDWVSIEDYLQGELISDVKHELIDGCVYAMAGASANHERITGNIYRQFGNHLDGSPCEPFGSDMKVKVGSNFFYPDVIVDCDFDESEPYYTESPVIIVEVLSKATRKTDETIKLLSYINIPSLQEYVLIEQDYVDIQVIRRNESWLPRHYFLGDDITFESIDLTLPVVEIYSRVQNEDMIEFLSYKPE
ncbi:Uma2 family endonuclease [Methylomarinum sp. Ch1-1]|uniref:Uma2 family endonuclease n=1 Tax=Methylomarinum roseum TaxID=3067653 RepID=A0AAU7NRC9_9GAMM|nr:Uma2 family endonuclease [Methylomarinum sp. Ch1-1]MDP4520843.1 Uma2 family endonuclease [Methylomarinum sp. Ch1-1]